MNETEIEFRLLRVPQIAQRYEIRVIVSIERYRHMEITHRSSGTVNNRIRQSDHRSHVHGLDVMPSAPIAVADMKSELDIRRHGARDTGEPCDHLRFDIHERRRLLRRQPAIPPDYLAYHIELDRQILMRDGSAELVNLP